MKDLEKIIEARGREFLLRVESSHDAGDYRKYEEVRNEVWGYPDDHFSATRNMMCENFLHEGSSLFIGAFARDQGGAFLPDLSHLAGFCYGYIGIRDKGLGFRDCGNLRFYSQFAAVREGYRSYGLGIRLKEFQREILLEIFGVGETICTYDPLTAVNASRNVHHFGMEVLEYRVATYGEYGGLLNRIDVPTDRFLMSWDLGKEIPGESAFRFSSPGGAEHVIRAESRTVDGKSGPLRLEVVLDSEPDPRGEFLLVRIPLDFYRMLQETDVEDVAVRRIPMDWRSHTRRALTTLLALGYRVIDFLGREGDPPSSFYLLKRSG